MARNTGRIVIYIFDPEKRSNIRKHIPKLYLSGVLTTEPFKILDSQRRFYKHLYTSRKTLNLTCEEAAEILNGSSISKSTKELTL